MKKMNEQLMAERKLLEQKASQLVDMVAVVPILFFNKLLLSSVCFQCKVFYMNDSVKWSYIFYGFESESILKISDVGHVLILRFP